MISGNFSWNFEKKLNYWSDVESDRKMGRRLSSKSFSALWNDAAAAWYGVENGWLIGP